MASGTKNLGLVKAIHAGNTAPANTYMIWYNTLASRHYYHNGSSWVELGTGGSGAFETIPHFVYQPLGVDSGMVYNDFEIMMDDVIEQKGKKTIYFDRTFLSALDAMEIPVKSGGGSWDFIDVSFQWLFESVYDTSNITISVADGNLWENFPDNFSFIRLIFNNTSFPVYSDSSGQKLSLLDSATTFENLGSVEVMNLSGSAEFVFGLEEGSKMKNGSYEIFNLVGNSSINLALIGAGEIEQDVIRGAITAYVDINLTHGGSSYKETQTNYAGTVELQSKNASRIMFGVLPNLGSISFAHNFGNEFLHIEVYRNSGFPKIRLGTVSEVRVQIDDDDNITITDLFGLGGINIQVVIASKPQQID